MHRRVLFACLATHFCLVALSITAYAVDESLIDKQIESTRREFGVRVHYRYDPIRYFSESRLKPPESAKAKQLELDDVERMIMVIDRFLRAHPKVVIKSNLKDIYLTADLQLYGKPFGGTNIKSALYINCREGDRSFSDDFVLDTCHHEFSSILMNNYPFPKDKWARINPPEFKYGKSGTEMLGKKQLLTEGDESCLSRGFLTKYSTSTMENDFNVLSGELFVKPKELKQAAEKYDKIAAKRDLAIKFYKSIDKSYKF
jgi:hypothetical protein